MFSYNTGKGSEAAATAHRTPSLFQSQEVSQSVPQLRLSPVLAKYKQYLQSCYNARVLAPADKYLPTLESPYINLAMIRREDFNSDERDEFTRNTFHGGVDQILERKTPINIEDLLNPEHQKDQRTGSEELTTAFGSSSVGITPGNACKLSHRPVRFILVEGPPGIGKSTFAWELCRRWDEIESLRNYHTVVLLKLREKWVLNATSLSDLFRYPSDPDFSHSIAEELVKSQGEKLLLVLDGFDEVSHSFHMNSVIKNILCRFLLPECTIILTTRPVAKATLRSICQPREDKHIEIIGFTEEERVKYITEVFSKRPELQVNFLKYMFFIPHIKSMMYIPLNCAIIAQVYYESQNSHHLAIPRTRTQLYKALTHSLLVRHMKMKDSNYECVSMLPEGLNKEDFKNFNTLAKFAFDSYHINIKGKLKKVTFFREDIPEGLIHFGFMNESTEMYAGKGVEQTFSFLHLSLQEYLAAWHLANNYSIGFQVAYHLLAVSHRSVYRGYAKEEEALISSLETLCESVIEPAIFLAGITGWGCQSENDRKHWEMYLRQDTERYVTGVLLQSLYEAHNPTLLPHYFAADDSRRVIVINSNSMPYLGYALSFCVAHSSYDITIAVEFRNDENISSLETFIKGLDDHCILTSPRITCLLFAIERESLDSANKCLLWILKSNFLNEIKEMHFYCSRNITGSFAFTFLQSLPNLHSLNIEINHLTSWEWLAAIKFLSKLQVLHIYSGQECSPPPTDHLCWLVEHRLTDLELDIHFTSSTIYNPTDAVVDSILKSVLRSSIVSKLMLPNISHETMASVHSILLHSPSLTTLELKRTRLGCDDILYICSALRNNTNLKHLLICNHHQFLQSKKAEKQMCAEDFVVKLNNLTDNTTLEEMEIQYGFFLPLTVGGDGEQCQLIGLGPLQQLHKVEEQKVNFSIYNTSSFLTHDVIQMLAKIELPSICVPATLVCNWRSLAHEPLSGLKVSVVNRHSESSLYNPYKITETVLDIYLCSTTRSVFDVSSSIDKSVDVVLKTVLRLNTFVHVSLSDISRETMAGVQRILLHCPSLVTLKLMGTRLGYDGILYICSALKRNKTLRCLMIHEDLQLPPYRHYAFRTDFVFFTSVERVFLPSKTTCTDLLLQLNDILKYNTTLEEIYIRSGLFLSGDYHQQWTGLGPLQQFNVGAISSGICPNLKRSFSSSDLTQPQTVLFWEKKLLQAVGESPKWQDINFKMIFFKKKIEGKKLLFLPSFSSPDTEVIQSFSCIDPRLKKCLGIPNQPNLMSLRDSCWATLNYINAMATGIQLN